MKTKTLLNTKVIALIVFLLCALFTTFSCSNLFSDVTTSSVSSGETKTPAGEVNRTITVTGTIHNPYEQPRNQSRSAKPSYAYSDKKYVVTATASDGSGTVSGTGNTTDNTFAIPLTFGKIWTIKVELQKQETGDTDYVKVMEGSYTFTQALTEVNAGIIIEIRPSMTSNGTGKIALNFATPTEQLYDSVAAEPVSEEQKAAWNAAAVSVSTSGINTDSIKSGVYSVTIRFYKSNVLVYATMQEISVYDYMTTSVWDGGGANSPINNGTFTVTQALIDSFKLTNLFVASTTSTPAGNDNNSGSPYKPLASISKALQYISVTGNGEAYTIWLMSNITESVELTTDTITTSKASSITIRPMQNPVTVTGRTSTVFEVETSVPITFENLTITGGIATFSGGGIYIDNGAEVTLANCTVTGNSVTGSGSVGGGICNSGTLKIKGKTNVTGNTSGSDADVKTDNIFLPDNKNITVSGTLDEDSHIGVTTATKPGYGSPVAFTTGFHANSGLEDTAISKIFTSDEGYAVVASGSGTNVEAALEASGGSINDVFDYTVTLSCEDDTVVPGSIVTVTATVKNGGTTVIPAANDITWNFELLCYGDSIATLQGASLVGYGAVQIPSNVVIFDGVPYTLHAKAVLHGVGYDEDFTLVGNSDTLSAQGFVTVMGATVSANINDVFNGRTLTIRDMYVCDHEVTQAEFAAVMGYNTSAHDGSSGQGPSGTEKQMNRPVDTIKWYDTLVYCNKRSMAEGLTPCYTINGSTNPVSWGEIPTSATHANYDTWNAVNCNFDANGYRLPTEVEWEYIARGGIGLTGTQYEYSGSNSLDAVAWYTSNSGNTTHEVKKKQPNALGIYDMSGNAWEWCWDRANTTTQSTPATGPTEGVNRVARGGACHRVANLCTVHSRGGYSPLGQGAGDGFRVVRTASGLTYIGSKAPSEPKAVGDIVFYDGSATPYTSGLTLTDAQKSAAIAVIFYVGTGLNNAGDTTTVRTLGVGLQQSENELKWCDENANAAERNISTVNENDKNGSDNLEQIGQFLAQNGSTDDTGDASKYPAFYYAKNYKDVTGSHVAGTAYESGWYLPSSSELTQVYLAKGTVNAAIALCGGKQFGSDEQDPFYRTSTQNSAADTNCFQIKFSDGTTTNYRKNYTHDNYPSLYFGYSSAIHQF